MIIPILFAIFFFVFLPGLVVEFKSLIYLYRQGMKEVVWKTLNPITSLLMFLLGVPALSFAFYSLLIVPSSQRAMVLYTALSEVNQQNSIEKNSIVHGLAATFGISLNDK